MNEVTKGKIACIDCKYEFDDAMTSYLLVQDDTVAFVDNNTNKAVPILMNALTQRGFAPEAVQFLILTHVHLDHAGGTSQLIKLCPNATILCHPNAHPHLVDPSRLIKGVRAVYGEDYDRLYGVIEPIDAKRIRTVKDGETIFLGSTARRPLRFWYTLGHARHHVVIYDEASKAIFTGDNFGIAYTPHYERLEALNDSRGLSCSKLPALLFPSASPIDFDAKEAHKSVDIIAESGATVCYLAHVGGVANSVANAEQMHAHLDYFTQLMDHIEQQLTIERKSPQQVTTWCREQLRQFFINELHTKRGYDLTMDDHVMMRVLKMDIMLNGSGIVVAVQRKLRRKAKQLKGKANL